MLFFHSEGLEGRDSESARMTYGRRERCDTSRDSRGDSCELTESKDQSNACHDERKLGEYEGEEVGRAAVSAVRERKSVVDWIFAELS